ncbi:unnamed protein product [Prunus armeniaca]
MLLSCGICPGLSTCIALIWLLSQRQVLEGDVIRVARISPNVETFNAFLFGFYQDDPVEKVRDLGPNGGLELLS